MIARQHAAKDTVGSHLVAFCVSQDILYVFEYVVHA